jgi:hypothetical protein
MKSVFFPHIGLWSLGWATATHSRRPLLNGAALESLTSVLAQQPGAAHVHHIC